MKEKNNLFINKFYTIVYFVPHSKWNIYKQFLFVECQNLVYVYQINWEKYKNSLILIDLHCVFKFKSIEIFKCNI